MQEGTNLIHGNKTIFALLLLIPLGLCECSRKDTSKSPVFVLGVDDRASGGQSGVKFDVEKCDKILLDTLNESFHLRPVSKRSDKVMRLQAIIDLASEQESNTDEESGVYRAVQVQLRLSPAPGSEGDPITSTGKAFLVQNPDSVQKDEGFGVVYKLAVANAVKYLDVQIDARSMSMDDLRKGLHSPDAQRRLYTLRSLRDRNSKKLYKDIIALLHDRDNEVALEAIGVLVNQHDQRAVIPLIRMSDSRDHVFLLQLISALSELGGPVARGYLFTLASGHASRDIRQRASEALEQLQEDDGKGDSQPKSVVVSSNPGAESAKHDKGGQR